MTQTFRKYFIALILFFSISEINAQVCTGTLGDPVINIDFGRGSSAFGPALPSGTNNYNFVTGTPNDGDYTISQNTFGMHSSGNGWFQINNHTPNDANGYMMVVNASNNPGLFYQTTITGLCPGTTYEFAAWIINILNYSGIKPNVTFQIETTGGIVLKRYDTGDILESTTATWKKYATIFTTSSNADIVLKIINNGPGGNGNDLALDDITFRACGPEITPRINGQQTAEICEGKTQIFQLSAITSSGYNTPKHQWQKLINKIWTNINGETNLNANVEISNAVSGSYQYRLFATEEANVGSTSCGIFSVPIVVNVIDSAKADAGKDKKILVGQSVELNGTATGNGQLTYAWNPPDYLDDPTKLNPIATPPTDITYTLTVTSDCNKTTEEVFIKVYPKIEIPNAFSPNDDGINDTWSFIGASAFSNPQLKIFNRNGQIIYESKGTFKPWDGKFNGKDLPPATYYYTLYLNEDFKIYSGWVLLTR